MGSTKPNKHVNVCLLSSRALTLSHLRDELWGPPFRLHTLYLGSAPTLHPPHFSLPRAQVYVIDALATPRATHALVAKIAEKFPSARALVIVKGFGKSDSCELLRLGVKGLLTHDQVRKQLRQAIFHVAAGGSWVPRALLLHFITSMLQSTRFSRTAGIGVHLSRREKEVYEAILENQSNKEIADKLHLSMSMVKSYVGNVLARFGVQRRVDLLLLSYQSGTFEAKSLGQRTTNAS